MRAKLKHKGKNRSNLVSEISVHKNIRADVVEDVLDGLVDVAIEEIVNTGEFYLRGLLTVKSSHYRGFMGGKGEVPAQQRINASLGRAVKTLWKIRHNVFGGATGKITRENWRQVAAEYADQPNPARSGTTAPAQSPSAHTVEMKSDPTDYNPFAEGYWDEDGM